MGEPEKQIRRWGPTIRLAQERYSRQREAGRERSVSPPYYIRRRYDFSSDGSYSGGSIRSPDYSPVQSPGASSDEEGFVATNVYDFRLSRPPSIAQSVSEKGGSDRDVGISGSNAISASKKEGLHIYESQYTGDAFIDGSHSARLTAVQDPKRQRQPLFRWLHLKHTVLNLDQLLDEVTHDPEINDPDRNHVAKLLAEVRKSSKLKQKADGSHVKYTPPMTLRFPLPSDDSSKSRTTYQRSMTWLCIPYFSLEEYSGLLSSQSPTAYPNQTLWQAQYSGNAQERDMQQVVCQINKGSLPPKSCFHISQLWAIVVDTCE